MSHVVQLSLKNKATLNLNAALVSTSKSYISVFDHISDEAPLLLFHLKQPNLVTQLDVTHLQNYQVLYFEKNNTLFDFKGLTYCTSDGEGNFTLQTQYKIVLFVPNSISIPIASLKGLHIFYSNKTLHWPKAICKSFTFKIPLQHVNSYNLSILEPLDIKQVSMQAFYTPSESLPLFIKTVYQTIPDEAFLYDLAKGQTIRYAVLFKSYLSGYLLGISIYEMSPSNLIPNLIYQEMKFIFNRKKQVPKIQERILRENGTERIELMEAFNFTKSTIQVSEIVSEADILYLNIESDASVLLLDFKDAQDYRVLFLNDNYWTVGSTFALNNKNGFVIQTRYKKIILMRYAFHLKRIEPKVYVHPPRSNIKKDILITVKSTSGNRLFSKTLKDWDDVEIDGFMTTLRVVVFSSKDGDVVKKYHFQKAYVEHEHELIGVKSRLYNQNIDNIDAKKSIEIIFVNPWSAEVFRELLIDLDDLDIDKFMDTNYVMVQTSKDNYFKTHYFWFKGRN